MIDIKDDASTHFDDELQFDDFDTGDTTSAPNESHATASPKTSFDKMPGGSGINNMTLNNPKKFRKLALLGALIIIVIAFIIYHFASNWNNPLNDISHAPTKIVAQPMTATPPQTATAVPSAIATPSGSDVSSEVSNKINTLNQTIDQQQQTITQLQGNISSMQDSINTLNSTVNTVSEQLAAINDKLTKPVAPPRPIKSAEVAAPPSINYIVKAMVPGRAWLQSSTGSTISVAVGNEVPTHGTVTQLDLNGGQVTASDGSVFTYDTNAG